MTLFYSISLIGVSVVAIIRRYEICNIWHHNDSFLCGSEGHLSFESTFIVLLAVSVIQTLPAVYQILVQMKMLCKSREVNRDHQEFKSIFEVETTDQGTAITIPKEKPEKEFNRSRSFYDARRTKHIRNKSKHDKSSQEISSDSNNTSSVEVKEVRTSSQNSQEFVERQQKQAFGR